MSAEAAADIRQLLVTFEEARVAEDFDRLITVGRKLLERLDEQSADQAFVLLLNLEVAYHNLFKRDGSGLARDVFDGLRPNRDTAFVLAGLYHLAYEKLVRERHSEMKRATEALEIVRDNRPFAQKNGVTMMAFKLDKAPRALAAWERVSPVERNYLAPHFARLQPGASETPRRNP